MKVLILHQHFKTPKTGGAIRSYYLAKALVDRGVKVVVITAHNESKYKSEIIENIEVHYLPVSYENKFGFFKRSTSFLKFAWKSARLARKIKDVQWCYAISVPLTVGLSAYWLKKRNDIPYAFEVGDLWPDAPIEMGVINNYFFQRLLYSTEKFMYEKAKFIVALSAPIKSAIEKKTHGKRIFLIPNMADTDFYFPSPKILTIAEKFNVKDKFVVSYMGALGEANGLDYFLECANASRKADLPIHFILCGEGAMKERIKNNIDLLKLTNISLVDFQNRNGIREIMGITDAAFISYKQVPILETGSPNKYFDALASGKLIVVNFGGWIKKEIEENHCGIYVDPRHPTDFVKGISPFLTDKKLMEGYSNSSRALAERKYSRAKLSEEFYKLFV